MKKSIKYVGMDVHKKTIDIAIAEGDREGEVRHYGTINHDPDSMAKLLRKLISTGGELRSSMRPVLAAISSTGILPVTACTVRWWPPR